jgi:KUP system potassium uptake protein
VAFSIVAISVFKWPKKYFLPLAVLILMVDLSFFSANLLKFAAGGYVPIVIGLCMFFIMDTWRWGRQWIGRAYQEHVEQHHMTVESILDKKRYNLEQGTSISLVVMASRPITSVKDHVPLILTIHYNNWRRLPKHIIFFSLVQQGSPYVTSEEERYHINVFKKDDIGTVVSVQMFHGYMERPDIRKVLQELKTKQMLKIP